MSDLGTLQRQLAAALVERGDIRSEAWRQAVERVPRHVLVPFFYSRRDSGFELVDGSRPEQRDQWLETVYDPRESLVTEYDPATLYPTSSATMPSIVLALLDALDLEPGRRVLDVGTGSGYLAALACERVGSDNVTSIDVGERVVELARDRLHEAGYTLHVVCGDGFDGYPPNAPYDRLVSTVGVARVPRAWVDQTRVGGLIVATMPEMTVRLQRHADGSASGRFVAGFAFMWMRGHSPAREQAAGLEALAGGDGDTRQAPANLRDILAGREVPSLWALARLLHMPFDTVVQVGQSRTGIVDATDRSWVRIDIESRQVTQGGPRRLWDTIEALCEDLKRCGRPERDRFGLTVRPDGSQFAWLDSPGSGHVWELVDLQASS